MYNRTLGLLALILAASIFTPAPVKALNVVGSELMIVCKSLVEELEAKGSASGFEDDQDYNLCFGIFRGFLEGLEAGIDISIDLDENIQLERGRYYIDYNILNYCLPLDFLYQEIIFATYENIQDDYELRQKSAGTAIIKTLREMYPCA